MFPVDVKNWQVSDGLSSRGSNIDIYNCCEFIWSIFQWIWLVVVTFSLMSQLGNPGNMFPLDVENWPVGEGLSSRGSNLDIYNCWGFIWSTFQWFGGVVVNFSLMSQLGNPGNMFPVEVENWKVNECWASRGGNIDNWNCCEFIWSTFQWFLGVMVTYLCHEPAGEPRKYVSCRCKKLTSEWWFEF